METTTKCQVITGAIVRKMCMISAASHCSSCGQPVCAFHLQGTGLGACCGEATPEDSRDSNSEDRINRSQRANQNDNDLSDSDGDAFLATFTGTSSTFSPADYASFEKMAVNEGKFEEVASFDS